MPAFHSRDLRNGRYSQEGHYYLLTAVTLQRRPVFSDFTAARICINSFRLQDEEGAVRSLAFVVMPDHFHWLVELLESDLAAVMRAVKGQSARLINASVGTSGTLWQRGYHDRGLRQDQDLVAAARYLVANPLRAALVENLWLYPHWDAVWVEGKE
ncbi:MAG: transposase [Proteobacteria bacterium]|nr:transposase [Pseudomonadota bacterium]MBU1060807.1 transposase [Pseudomonadota bacterium]